VDGFNRVDEILRDVLARSLAKANRDQVYRNISELKRGAVARGDQEMARRAWCFETTFAVQNLYIDAFSDLKNADYQAAWNKYAQIESLLSSLARHFRWDILSDPHKLGFMRQHTKHFQALFPYRLFTSPAILVLEKRCSICGAHVRLRKWCGHEPGELYNGELCSHEVLKVDILEVSFVTKPVWKGNIVFPVDPDTGETRDSYDYTQVKSVAEELWTPWDPWNIEWSTEVHAHSEFTGVSVQDFCPCGSMRAYGDCCRNKPSVEIRRGHIVLTGPPTRGGAKFHDIE